MSDFETGPEEILERLRELRATDAPTHGGQVLSYVYDSGMAELDELAAAAMRLVQPVNGLDPTTFPSVAALERDVVGFVRDLVHGDDTVVGSVTTGGTESCLLAVKTARDNWRLRGGAGRPRLLAPVTVHAAFQKAAHFFDLDLDLVAVEPASGMVSAGALSARFGPDVALVVVSAPSYPFAALDPVADVAAAALDAGIDCHVDACIGGLILPFWSGLGAWDFAVEGVTSISADLHKFGYSPKGASVLLQRGRDRQRSQYFATTRWPGYPVVNPTILGSKSAGALAAAWAIIQALGIPGFARLAASCERSTSHLVATISKIEGLRVVGAPVGPLVAVTTDDSIPVRLRVDPHHWADRVRQLGWLLQLQPSIEQPDGTRLPRTTHLTVTPVTEGVLGELARALSSAADQVRGVPPVSAAEVLGALPSPGSGQPGSGKPGSGQLDSETAFGMLTAMGLGSGGGLPDRMAPLLAMMEGLAAPIAERLLIELLARLVEPVN